MQTVKNWYDGERVKKLETLRQTKQGANNNELPEFFLKNFWIQSRREGVVPVNSWRKGHPAMEPDKRDDTLIGQ
jgi:hypothetical protein